MPVGRVVWLQPHLQEQAKIAEDKQWQELEHYVIPKRQKQRLAHQSQTGVRIYHYHNDHLGTPQELTNALGEVVWLNYSQAWGGSYDKQCFVKELDNVAVSADVLQPLRFQGQFFDTETSFHYNRFRYYDSDVGMFVSRDPIGLMGGDNVFAYAPNPIQWIDPFGLAKTPASCKCQNCPPEPTYGITENIKINKGSDAPVGAGIYEFKHKTIRTSTPYIGSTNDFTVRMTKHMADGNLASGEMVKFIHINTFGRSENGARRVRRFFEQQRIGVTNGIPNKNITGYRAVSPEKWKLYTKNNKPDYCNAYFK